MLSLLCKDLCVFIVALRGKAETVFTSSLCCKFLCDIVTLWSEVCFLVLFECTDEATEQAVVDYAVAFPAHGQHRTSNELRKQDVFISGSGVRSVWLVTP